MQVVPMAFQVGLVLGLTIELRSKTMKRNRMLVARTIAGQTTRLRRQHHLSLIE